MAIIDDEYIDAVIARRDKYEVARQKFLEEIQPWLDTKMNLYETCRTGWTINMNTRQIDPVFPEAVVRHIEYIDRCIESIKKKWGIIV
jgi:hypothetical protein